MIKGQKLPRITAQEVSRMPDQTSAWLNRLKDKVEKLETDGAKASKSSGTGTLTPATTTQLGGVIVGDNLTVSPSGRLSATGGTSTYAQLPDKPQINDTILVGNKSLPDLDVNALTNWEIENLINNT